MGGTALHLVKIGQGHAVSIVISLSDGSIHHNEMQNIAISIMDLIYVGTNFSIIYLYYFLKFCTLISNNMLRGILSDLPGIQLLLWETSAGPANQVTKGKFVIYHTHEKVTIL